MYFVKYCGKTTTFKDFDEMKKWALDNAGALMSIAANLNVRRILDTVGAVFIYSYPLRSIYGLIVTNEQVYKMSQYERDEHVVYIFRIDQDDLKTV